MKKLLNISVIAALAILPMAANAAPSYADAIPAEPVDASANTNVASTSYVRGAYNAAIAVANKENQRALAAEGDLTTLTTTNKTSLVNAINEVNSAAGFAGTAAALTDTHFTEAQKASAAAAANAAMTAAQTGITNAATAQSAANAAQADADALEGIVGNTGLQTTAQTVTAAINELKTTADSAVQSVEAGTDNGTISVDGGADITVYDDSVLSGRVTDVEDDIGEISTLTTTEKGSLVQAINEVNSAAGFAGTDAALTDTHFTEAQKASAAAAANAAMTAAQTGITNAAAAQADADALEGIVGNTGLQTTAQTVTAAINELKTAADTQSAKVLKVYTTWNTDTNQEVALTAPTTQP